MIVAITFMIIATVAVAALVLAPRLGEGRVVYEETPDHAPAFGADMSWLAVRTKDTSRLVAALGLEQLYAANWSTGLGTAYSPDLGETRVFVSPPVNGWTFVVGRPLPQPLGKAFLDKTTPLLLDLGREFIELQYFLCGPQIDHFAWARVIDGRLVRAFAIGDEGVLWNKGKPGKEEKAMGLKLFELRGVRGRRGDAGNEIVLYPTEQHVMHLASKWSIDPSRIDGMGGEPALGWVGTAPSKWRSERAARQTAA